MTYPDAPFSHLQRLTDNIGLLQHADGVVPLHTDGYGADDVTRGLLVVCREPSPPQELVVLGLRYLYFLAQAQALGGRFRNHLGCNRQWQGQPGTGDGWGCALWALGTDTVTADDTWLADVRMCLAWFLGDNDAKVPLIDERAGGCSDGLTGTGRSRNQGAESTLAVIAVLRHGRGMGVAPARAPVSQGNSPAGAGSTTPRD